MAKPLHKTEIHKQKLKKNLKQFKEQVHKKRRNTKNIHHDSMKDI